MKTMTKSNTKDFFVGMQVGEKFMFYANVYTFGQVAVKADKAGYGIRHLGANGCEVTSVPGGAETQHAAPKEKQVHAAQRVNETSENVHDDEPVVDEPTPTLDQAKAKYAKVELAEAIRYLLSKQLNRPDMAQRAAWMISLAAHGSLGMAFRVEAERMGKEKFKHYYGGDLDYMIHLAMCMEDLRDNARVTCGIAEIASDMIGDGGAFFENYKALSGAGMTDRIIDFGNSFFGRVTKITAVPMSNRTACVIQTVDDDEVRSFPASDPTRAFETPEEALMFEMFGKELLPAVIALYDSYQPKE